jgi:hypothetical protein
MGQFSWITQDTNRSISSIKGSQFRVIMTDDKGNQWVEDNYEGYGEFGGKDYYILLAEMNDFYHSDPEVMRAHGIDLEFDENGNNGISPSLSECGAWFHGKYPEICPDQGWVEYDENGERVSEQYSEY